MWVSRRWGIGPPSGIPFSRLCLLAADLRRQPTRILEILLPLCIALCISITIYGCVSLSLRIVVQIFEHAIKVETKRRRVPAAVGTNLKEWNCISYIYIVWLVYSELNRLYISTVCSMNNPSRLSRASPDPSSGRYEPEEIKING